MLLLLNSSYLYYMDVKHMFHEKKAHVFVLLFPLKIECQKDSAIYCFR